MKDKRKPRRRNAQPERALHAHVGQMLAWLKPLCICIPVPNGAADLGKKLGGILKAQYKIKAGVSDWLFLWGWPLDINEPGRRMLDVTHIHVEPGGFATCAGIELKIGDGKQSQDQVLFEDECKRWGIPYRIAKSVDELVLLLEGFGRLPHGTSRRIRGFNPEIKT